MSEFLEATFEAMEEGVTIFDESLHLVAWNDRFVEVLGETSKKFATYGASLIDLYVDSATKGLFGPGDPKALADARIAAIESGPLIHTEELTPGPNRHVRINRFRLKNGGVCATFRDITEERQVAEQLRQTQKMEAIGRLTGGVAHDLNNVLAVVIGNVELLANSARTPFEHESLSDVLRAATRGADLTRRLLAFSRQQDLAPQPTAIAPQLISLASLLRRVLGEGIEVSVQTVGDLWPSNVDAGQFHNTMLNLALNARDAMPSGGKLLISASNRPLHDASEARGEAVEPGDYVSITFSDTGLGMSEETRMSAFDPFFTTKPIGRGTGLGLSMAHGFVKQSGGGIRIQSRLGEGTTVQILLPRYFGAVDDPEHGPVQGQRKPRVSLAGNTIFVVEDDEQLRALVVRQLRDRGCRVIEAGNAELALQMSTKGESYDLLLTDVVLSGPMNGPELARQVLASRPDLPVVFMTGYTDDVIVEQARLDPGVTLLSKPFRMAALIEALHAKLQQTS